MKAPKSKKQQLQDQLRAAEDEVERIEDEINSLAKDCDENIALIDRLLTLPYLTGNELEFLHRVRGQMMDEEDQWQLDTLENLHRFDLIERERAAA